MIAQSVMRQAGTPSELFALPRHGGDIAAAERRFGCPRDGWLDLSTGISPRPYPVSSLDLDSMRKLPGRVEEEELCRVAASYYGGDPERIVPVPGSQSIIQLLPRLRPFSRIAVVGPTYADHAEAWTRAGHMVLPCETLERVGDAEVVVVVNPNNPDGRRHDKGRLIDLAGQLIVKGGTLIVDEAFVDATPELSVADQAGPGLLVLRSFGKFFGLPGLRLGFVLGDAALGRMLRDVLGDWPVNGPALTIAKAAFTDIGWIEETRSYLAAESMRMDRLLSQYGFSVIGGTSMFRLASVPRAWALYEHLGQRGILVRPFAAAPRWLRFGLPANEEEWARLIAALDAWEA